MATAELNGHMTVEQFRDQANRKKSVSRLDALWDRFNRELPPEAAPKVLPKATRVYEQRRQELDSSTKTKAHEVIHSDVRITRTCLIGKIGCAVLSSYLNAQAAVLGMKESLRESPDVAELLATTCFPGTSINFGAITEIAAFVYGLVIPWLVLLLWMVAGYTYLRGRKRIAAWTGGAGAFVLLLSVWHCTDSLRLFGLPWIMALLLALGIDYGLVSFEVSAIFSHETPHSQTERN